MSSELRARLRGGVPRRVRHVSSVVMVMHGGREQSVEPVSAQQLAVVRMLDMIAGLRRRSTTTAVYLLQFRMRGWNRDPDGRRDPAPVADARHALSVLQKRHPDARIALLGHSMGGRTAFAVAGHPDVAGVCALAPWLPDGEPLVAARPEQRFVIAHGTADRMTSARASLRYAERLRTSGAAVARLELAGGRHALLDKPWLWHRLAVRVPLGLVGDGSLPPTVADGFASDASLRLSLEQIRAGTVPAGHP